MHLGSTLFLWMCFQAMIPRLGTHYLAGYSWRLHLQFSRPYVLLHLIIKHFQVCSLVPLCLNFSFTMKIMLYPSARRIFCWVTKPAGPHNLLNVALFSVSLQTGSGFLENVVQRADFFPQSIKMQKMTASARNSRQAFFCFWYRDYIDCKWQPMH